MTPMGFTVLFMLAQSLAALPALLPGTTVMIVSDDLLTIHARGAVEAGRLTIDAALPPGQSLQLLFYPPSDSPESEPAPESLAGARQGLQSLRVTVASGGQDLLVPAGGNQVSLRQWLQSEHGLELHLPAD